MMEFDARAGYLIIGCLIGFVLGYIVRSLKKIEETVKEVDDIVRHLDLEVSGTVQHNVTQTKPEDVIDQIEAHKEGEDGRANTSTIILNFALLAVILVTVWAAFASQQASNKVEDTQLRVAQVEFCNQDYLDKVIIALNERTVTTQEQLKANVALQLKLRDYFDIIQGDPNDTVLAEAREAYSAAATTFVKNSELVDAAISEHPFPPNEAMTECLNTYKENNE